MIVEGFPSPLAELADEALRGADPRELAAKLAAAREDIEALCPVARASRDGEARQRTTADVRADFPIFARSFDGQPLVYLDSAPTSQKPAAVIDALDDTAHHNANIHRGVYALAQEADAPSRARAADRGVRRRPSRAATIFTQERDRGDQPRRLRVGPRQRRRRATPC